MAAKSHLPAATLCFLLVVLAAQGKDNDTVAILVIDGKAQCKSNPSRIISNVTVQLMIDNVTIPGGNVRTTNTGQMVMAVKLTSQEQVAALLTSSKAFLVAPAHACGAPAGMKVAAPVQVIAVVSGGAGPDQTIGGDTSTELLAYCIQIVTGDGDTRPTSACIVANFFRQFDLIA